MDRLIASNSVPLAQADTAPATGTPQYATDGNPATNTPATLWPAYAWNALQDEIYNVIVGAGLTPDRNVWNQLLLAVKRLIQDQVVLADTGAANAYAAANTPPLVAGTWVNGVVQQIVVAHTNTGASTYTPDGLPAIPIYGLGLQPLQGNEMFAGGTASLMKQTIPGVNSGNPICVLLECAGGAQQVPPATASGHAAQLGQIGHGQCRLSVASATSLKLSPYNGNVLVINGIPQTIPSAGVTLSNAGLAASTLYYVYAYMNSGTMTLEVVTTSHATGTNGVEIKSGDATRTLVGMIYTNASSQFVDSASSRTCLNWFNRRKIIASTNVAGPFSFTNSSLAELTSTARAQFLMWSDDVPLAHWSSYGTQTSGTPSATTLNFQLYMDSTTQYGPGLGVVIQPSWSQLVAQHGALGGLSEGLHYSTLFVDVGTNGGTLAVNNIQNAVNIFG